MTALLLLLAALTLTVVAIRLWTRRRPEETMGLALRLARRLLGLRKHRLVVDGVGITWLEGGHGDPLVLLHGLGADKDNFLAVAALLSRHYRVILPDLPGFGDSDHLPDASYGVAAQVERLQGFCAALELPKIDLGGNSMGGFIAAAYAAAHPGQVSTLWLLAPAGLKTAPPSALLQQLAAGLPAPILARSAMQMREVLDFVMHRRLALPRFVLEAMARQQDRHYEHHCRVMHELLDGPSLEDFLRPPALTIPTLVVWGEKDRALDPSGAYVLLSLLPRARLRLIPAVGHVPQIEAPRRVVRDYLLFRGAERLG